MKALLSLLLFASTAAYADERPDGTVTLPEGGIGVAATVNTAVRTVPHSTSESLSLAGAFGVTGDVTVGASYAFELHDPVGWFPSDGRWKGPLLVHGELELLAGPRVFVTVGADAVYHLENSNDRAIHLGAAASLRLSAMFSVFTGEIVPNAPAGQQLTIAIGSDAPVTLAFPAGLVVRPELPLYAYVETTLAHLAIAHASSAIIIADFIPVEAGTFYRARADLDIGAAFQDDLEHAGDAFTIGITARYYSR